MFQRPPISTRTATPCPYPSLFRSSPCFLRHLPGSAQAEPTPMERYRPASPDSDRRRRPPRTPSQSPKVEATISHHDCCGGADGQVVRVQATCQVLQTSAQRDGYRYIPAWRRLLRPRTATRSEEHTSELQSLMR